MRRSIVPLSLLVAATAVMVLLAGGPASGAQRAPRIACVMPRSPLIVPCCPVPTGGAADAALCCASTTCCAGGSPTRCCDAGGPCCGGGACCAPTVCGTGGLTIGSSPDPSTAGRKVVISGVLSGTQTAGAQVALWRKLARQPTFQQVAQTTSDGAGGYMFAMARGAVMADQQWYVTSGSVRSATIVQQVRALVGLTASTSSRTAGGPISLRGHVTPSHAGQVVLIEQARGAVWHVVGRARLGRRSNYGMPYRFPRLGRVKLRAVLPGDARNLRSASPVIVLAAQP